MKHRASTDRGLQGLLRFVPGVLLALLCSLDGTAQSIDPVVQLPPPIDRSELGRRYEEALRLNASEFEAYLTGDVLSQDLAVSTRLRAFFVRAGTLPPPGLSTARSARREATRKEALDYLAARFATGDPLLERELARVLDDPLLPDVLWAAAATIVGETLRYDLAFKVSAGLAPDRSARVRSASIRALHDLFVRWFEDDEAFETVRRENGDLECGSFFRERLVETDALSRRQAIRLVELESPADNQGRGARAMLTHPDPAVRAAAARVLGRAIASGAVDAGDTIAILLLHLELEADASVWQATVKALLEPLASAPIDSPELADLRGLLERLIGPRDDLRSAIAWTLMRIPWDTEDITAEASVLVGIDRMSRLFEEIAVRSPVRDEDELLLVLNSLEGLFAMASDAGIDLRSRPRRARETLLRLVVDPEVSNDIRLSAAASLALVAPVEDAAVLASVLESEGLATSLAYGLLGALGQLAEFARPETDAGNIALSSLVEHTRHPEVDLRLRAYNLLLQPELEFLVRLTRPAIWIERLENEQEPGLQSNLLRLLARDGKAATLDALLNSPSFDRVRAGDARQIGELGEVLRAWVAGDPSFAVRAAERMRDPASPVLLQQALTLVAGMKEPVAAALPGADHCKIRSWAFELVPHGNRLLELRCEEGLFVERVLTTHIPNCAPDPSVNLAHERAVLSGLLLAHDSSLAVKEEVDALFEEALQWNAANGDARRRIAILLSRARFAFALGDKAPALDDYRAARDGEIGLEGESSWTPRDVRSAIRLAKETDADPADRALEAARFYERLVRFSAWKSEPDDLRLVDLRSWATESLESRDVIRIEAARAAIAGEARLGLEESTEELDALVSLLENYGAP